MQHNQTILTPGNLRLFALTTWKCARGLALPCWDRAQFAQDQRYGLQLWGKCIRLLSKAAAVLSSAQKSLSGDCAALGKFTVSYSMCQGAPSLWQLHAKDSIPLIKSLKFSPSLHVNRLCKQEDSMNLGTSIYSDSQQYSLFCSTVL